MMSSYIWPFLICSVASTSTGMTDTVGFNCHIMDWSWARYWLDNSSDITPEKTSNIYVKGCLRNCKIFSTLNYLHELSWTKTETNCVTVSGNFKGKPCVFPVKSLVSTMREETSLQLPLDIATLDIAAVLPIATSTPIELKSLALHK